MVFAENFAEKCYTSSFRFLVKVLLSLLEKFDVKLSRGLTPYFRPTIHPSSDCKQTKLWRKRMHYNRKMQVDMNLNFTT